MIRKRKTIPFILLLVYLLPAAVQAQDILVFNDTTGLPDCAHDCMDLYSAQYECPPGRDRVDCFCDTGFVSSKPKGWGCDNSCTTKEERDRVLAFLARTCGTPEEEGDGETVKNKDHLGDSNSTYTDSKTDPQAEKAANWWRKNWVYFFLAFMFVAIAVLAFAFTGPIRKYIRRQSIKRRLRQSGQGMLPYWAPSAPSSKISSVAHPRGYSDPLSPSRYTYGSGGLREPSPQRGRGLSYINSGGLGSYSEVGTPSDPGPSSGHSPALTPPPGPTIRTLFASYAAVSTRQESWERGIREENRKQGWFARKFWRRSGDAEKPYGAVGYNIGRAV